LLNLEKLNSKEEYYEFLEKKLLEEFMEFIENKNLEELEDIMKVLYGIEKALSYSEEEHNIKRN
jgi:predicted house-cleaning noncanonical NTP pyrophosphatase (MazG superfamily)